MAVASIFHVRHREFITLLGGATAWPLAARAQQPERMRRIGVLMNLAADDREGQARLVAFQQALQQLGWSEGRNMRMDTRWGENDIDRQRRYAAELVALAPDVILASGGVSVSALQHVTRTLPIVFAAVGDPVGIGLVDSLARPGGNVTGISFMTAERVRGTGFLRRRFVICAQTLRLAGPRPSSAAGASAPTFTFG
jgi:putative tryptophan/tyrosine transport system substrate-binding protein